MIRAARALVALTAAASAAAQPTPPAAPSPAAPSPAEPAASAAAVPPSRAATLVEEGRAALDDGRPRRAEEVLEEAVALAPGDAAAHHWLALAHRDQLDGASKIRKLRLSKKVRHGLERAIELEPTWAEPRLALVGFHLTAPSIAGGRVEEAREQARQLEAIDPAAAAVARADIQAREGELADAVETLSAAAAERPGDRRLALRLADACATAGQPARALAALAPLVERDPGDALAVLAHARIATDAGLDVEAAEDTEAMLRRFLERRPDAKDALRAAAFHFLGVVLEARGDAAGALDAHREAARLAPEAVESAAAVERLSSRD